MTNALKPFKMTEPRRKWAPGIADSFQLELGGLLTLLGYVTREQEYRYFDLTFSNIEQMLLNRFYCLGNFQGRVQL